MWPRDPMDTETTLKPRYYPVFSFICIRDTVFHLQYTHGVVAEVILFSFGVHMY